MLQTVNFLHPRNCPLPYTYTVWLGVKAPCLKQSVDSLSHNFGDMEAKLKLVHAADHYSNIDESRVSLTTTLGTSLMSFCIAGDDVVLWRRPHELCADRTFPPPGHRKRRIARRNAARGHRSVAISIMRVSVCTLVEVLGLFESSDSFRHHVLTIPGEMLTCPPHGVRFNA